MIRTGMITEMDAATYHENWMIVRLLGDIPDFAKHVPELSPSPELFLLYRNAVHTETFDKTFFDKQYVPRFLKDFSQNAEALMLLRKLCRESREKDIFLCCFCADETLCHRSIIAGLLLGMGAEIDTNPYYSKYYDMYMQIQELQ